MKKVFYILFFILIVIIALQTMYIFNLHKDIESLTSMGNIVTDHPITNASTNTSDVEQTYVTNSSNITYITNTENTNTTNTLDDEPTEKYYPEKVQITVKKDTITKTGATIVINDMNFEESTWDLSYSIHQKRDNFWVAVTPITDPVFEDIALVSKDNVFEQEINWKTFYGTLPNGTYRIVKTKYINGEYVQFHSNEFTLSSTKK